MVASVAWQNTLYRGLDNYVEVSVPGVPCEHLHVTMTNGEITGDGCLYAIKPGQQHMTWLMATWSTPHGTDSAGTPFRVREIPLPQACFAGSCEDLDSIPVSHIKVAQGVVARLMDFGFDYSLKVVHYRLQILRKCTSVFDGRSSEARLTSEMSAALNDVVGEDQLIISEIQVKNPSGMIQTLAPLRLVAR